MHRLRRSEEAGIEQMVERVGGMLHVEGDTAVFQIEYLEQLPRSRSGFGKLLSSMKRLATAHGASSLRIEAAIANLKLSGAFVHRLGPPKPGEDPKFLDTWTVHCQ